ncbi:MAG: rRNA maturation RNase YbeY [Bacteroidales bacterium]|jgi:rRNA maturation RNase YbeY|nr:rRNA maturation RNase YbeY [Bacteroidales bacterium]
MEYFYEDTDFVLQDGERIGNWIEETILNESMKLGDVSFIFCSDEYLLQMNKEYLDHDYYTDVITFDYCEGDIVSGDIFISVDTVKSNSEKFITNFASEIKRVIIHGVLHLIGYKDKSDEESKEMRAKEDYYLSLY